MARRIHAFVSLAALLAGCGNVLGTHFVGLVGDPQDAGVDGSPGSPDAAKDAVDSVSPDSSDATVDAVVGVSPDSSDATGGAVSSCLDVLTANPSAPSGVYPIEVDGRSYRAYCDMTLDGGGWTAFFVGMVGWSHVFGHFDLASLGAKDVCPDPATECLRLIPSHVTTASRFAAICGQDAVAFSAPEPVLGYFRGLGMAGWVTLADVQALRGSPHLTYASKLFTGQGSDYGWILSSDINSPNETSQVFASSFNWIASTWGYCNGVNYNQSTGATPVEMLLYR